MTEKKNILTTCQSKQWIFDLPISRQHSLSKEQDKENIKT